MPVDTSSATPYNLAMSVQQLLYNMCAELPDADLNAIRKARGFSTSETASRTSFASFYMTAIGLTEAVSALSTEEIFTLRLLHETGEVDVAFFERLYGADTQSGTYTQRFKPVFDIVKKKLVRRGLVIMAEIKMRGDAVQLERWRYAIPSEFVRYLPPLPTVQNDQTGQITDQMVRTKLLQLVGGGPAFPNDTAVIAVKHGSLYLNDNIFTVAALASWQVSAWAGGKLAFGSSAFVSLSQIEAVRKLLSPNEWTAAKELEPALKIYCFGEVIPSVEKLLHKGWEVGLLSRLKIASDDYYRIAAISNANVSSQADPESLDWVDMTSKPGSVKIDLRLIPLIDLEQINRLTHLTVENKTLIASPRLIKLGRATSAQRNSMISRWLAEHIPGFGTALETVNARWGKTLLHENLLVARVRDLNLRVQLERELKEKIIVLSDHFIAFPRESRAGVEKILKKTGFIVKTVKP